MSLYLCVLDFEATCWKDVVKDSQEIIEFPSVLYRLDPVYEEVASVAPPYADDADDPILDADPQDEEHTEYVLTRYNPTFISEFSKYVRPTLNPQLSEFCTELTGITQETVDAADTFETVYNQHHQWLLSLVPYDVTIAFVTVGNWDIQTMLPKEISNKKLRLYRMYRQFINIKTEFDYFYGQKSGSMVNMLNKLGIPLEGKHHSGIDDTRNTAKILLRLLADGHIAFQIQTLMIHK